MQSILLVEDDKHIVDNLTEYLEGEGFRVGCASGQAAALERLEQEQFDLILLDISLYDGNGFAVCSAVKALYHLPVIFLTASGDEYSTVTGFEVGADDYIPKPFRPRELLMRIKNVLRRTGSGGGLVRLGRVSPCGGLSPLGHRHHLAADFVHPVLHTGTKLYPPSDRLDSTDGDAGDVPGDHPCVPPCPRGTQRPECRVSHLRVGGPDSAERSEKPA